MNKQTAVKWLKKEFDKWSHEGIVIPKHLFEQALQMERERIIHANMQGRLHNSNGESWKVEDAEYEANEWYVKTYGGQDE